MHTAGPCKTGRHSEVLARNQRNRVTVWRGSAQRLTWCAHTPRALPQRRRSVHLSRCGSASAPTRRCCADPIERARGCSQLDLAGARGEGAEGFPAGRPLPDLRPEPECAPPPRFARCSPAPVHSLSPLPRAEESRYLPLLSLSPSWPSAAESRREPLSCTPLSRPPGRALPRAEESRSLPLLSPALSRSVPLSPAHSRVPRAVATVEHKPPMATRLPALPGTPPTPRTMSARQATSRENMRSTQQFMSTFKGTTQQPRERYGRPQTSSHDVGWDARPLTPRNPRFQANRRMCAETVYANKYTMMTGIGPYSPR